MKKIFFVLMLPLFSFCITNAKEIGVPYLMIEEYTKNNPTLEIVCVSYDSTFTKVYVGFHTNESGHRVKVSVVGLYNEVFMKSIVYCNVYQGEEFCFVTFDANPNKETIIKRLSLSDFVAEIADY